MQEAGEAKRAYQVVQRSVPKLLVPVHERQVIVDQLVILTSLIGKYAGSEPLIER
jgi:hypothetical protein